VTVEVSVTGIELTGRHGVDDDERARPQRFRFDVSLALADDIPVASDRLEDTVDYRDVVACVREVSASREYRLLEALGGAIVDELQRRFSPRAVSVSIAKPDLDLGDGASPAVTVRWP
jgi:dihydroneopterin aldolase